MATDFEVISKEFCEANDEDGRYVDEFDITSRMTGDLAERIKAKVGAPADAEVTIREQQVDASYSEWTVDSDYYFDLFVNGEKVDFDSIYAWSKESAIGKLSEWLERKDG